MQHYSNLLEDTTSPLTGTSATYFVTDASLLVIISQSKQIQQVQ